MRRDRSLCVCISLGVYSTLVKRFIYIRSHNQRGVDDLAKNIIQGTAANAWKRSKCSVKVVMNIIQMVQREKFNAVVSHLTDFEPESVIHRKLDQGKCNCDKYF